MYFIMNNVPTITIMNAAIEEGIIDKRDKQGFISIEKEMQLIKETRQQYEQKGKKKGASKDYRKNNFWRDAKVTYEYDPVRGLYYMEVGDEPVMDEFDRDDVDPDELIKFAQTIEDWQIKAKELGKKLG